MKLPFEMVVRACVAYNVVVIRHDPAQMAGMRAALEAVLSECAVVKVRGRVGEPAMINVSHSMVGKRVPLVVLDD
jgi:putative transposon-encoded protein